MGCAPVYLKLALIASMRKILLIVHAMYRDKTEYITV